MMLSRLYHAARCKLGRHEERLWVNLFDMGHGNQYSLPRLVCQHCGHGRNG